MEEPYIFYECDCNACKKCDYLHCAATTKIEHALNFINIDGNYFEKSSIDCFDLPHKHICEIELFHKKDKIYWKTYCPRQKKPNKKFMAGWEDICDDCKHSITIDFYKDENLDCVRARSIHRSDI